ncbi:unnamed protein product [Arctogadus glacialis]
MKRDMRRDSATIERKGREGEERDGDAEGVNGRAWRSPARVGRRGWVGRLRPPCIFVPPPETDSALFDSIAANASVSIANPASSAEAIETTVV